MCPHTLNRYTKTFAKQFKFFSLRFSLVPFLFSFPENGTKTEPPQNPEIDLFLIERGFSSVYKSYLSVLNSFYINSTIKQKVRFFGPVLVPFPENGTKKCLVPMKIAFFCRKLLNMCPHTLNRYTKTFAKQFKFFSLRFSLVPFLFSFPENGTKTEPPQNPEIDLFLIERGFSSVYKSYLSVLNSFYINSTIKQKVRFFGPVLVPFPENGTKKCLVPMKIAFFL